MQLRILKFLIILLITGIIFSCKTEEPIVTSPLDGLTKLNEGYALGASTKVEIWGIKNYFSGYNKLTVVLLDSLDVTKKIMNAQISFSPLMTMGSGAMIMKHSAPVENPTETAIDDVFGGAVVFIMPTTSDGFWQLNVEVLNHSNNKNGTVTFDISVDNSSISVMKSFVSQSSDSSKLFVSMLEPAMPIVGINDIEFTIHKKSTMMSFPPDSTYTIEITPEMPSMGHGSPNNVNPVSTGNGHYKGKVNFTMTGEWKINVVVKKDNVAVSNGLFFTVIF